MLVYPPDARHLINIALGISTNITPDKDRGKTAHQCWEDGQRTRDISLLAI
jgi:hypothetical protein